MEKTIPLLLRRIVSDYPDAVAQMSKDTSGEFHPITYKRLAGDVEEIAAGLYELGVRSDSHVGLISENRREWFLLDLALLHLRAADVPRGCDATTDEIRFILDSADTQICAVEDAHQLERLLSLGNDLPGVEQIIVLDPAFTEEKSVGGKRVLSLASVQSLGREALTSEPDRVASIVDAGEADDVATLIYTSGTTGEPKGVMLTHENFLHQVKGVPELIHVGPGDIWLCVLPVWHSFERIMQYVALGTASSLAYSKPIGKILLEDFQKVKPTWMASVPRIWEAIQAGIYRNVKTQSSVTQGIFHFFVALGGAYATLRNMVLGLLPRFHKRVRVLDVLIAILPLIILWPFKKLGDALVFKKIKSKLGGRFVAGISGGGALPSSVDRFFSAAGILLLEGYGLTETAPVLGVRAQDHPVPGTVGPVFPGTEIKIVDDAGRTLPPGNKGLVLARGPQIMKGYYKKPELTAEMIDSDGWLNTGDLGMLTWDNELKITGRAKDTIVLLGGENVEPNPIEEKLRESEFVSHAILLGQDQKFLAALLVPEFDSLSKWAEEQTLSWTDNKSLVAIPEVQDLYNTILKTQISAQNGFKNFERVFKCRILDEPFEPGRELSAKQEVKRHVVYDLYAKEIKSLFN